MFDHPSRLLQPAALPEILPPNHPPSTATATDLSNHLSHTPETPVKQPPQESRFVLSCAGDKRSLRVRLMTNLSAEA